MLYIVRSSFFSFLLDLGLLIMNILAHVVIGIFGDFNFSTNIYMLIGTEFSHI